MVNKEKGITLIALIVTVVILLILIGIAIVQLVQYGLLDKSKVVLNYEDNTIRSERDFVV